jgi:hypothetical protein
MTDDRNKFTHLEQNFDYFPPSIVTTYVQRRVLGYRVTPAVSSTFQERFH